MVIFLNMHCSYGRGMKRWEQIENQLRSRIERFTVRTDWTENSLPSQVDDLLHSGETVFIAAGGDGTVNLLTNVLMSLRESRDEVVLGAIGLGSSNDYHKFSPPQFSIDGIPMKVDAGRALAQDVIRIRFGSGDDRSTRFCLNNASIGITAEANGLFNDRPRFVCHLRKLSVNAAIAATAIRTIVTYRNIRCQIAQDGYPAEEVLVTNLGIVKNPHFAGSFCYEPSVQPDDGWLGVHLCEAMSRLQAIDIMLCLSGGKFRGHPRTRTTCVRSLAVQSRQPFALEFDGEVVRTNAAEFSIMKKALRCCQ